MTAFLKDQSIKYLNREFPSFKRDLINFSQAHHSGVFQDYNETSPGMALMEFCAYVGDVLSYYQDMQFNELKQETARQVKNVVSIAKQHGYRPAGKRAARCSETFFIEVPAINKGNELVPDDSYSPILRKGSRVRGPGGVAFETVDDLQFSASLGRLVTGSQFDNTTGLPTHFAIRKNVDVTAGTTITEQYTVGDFQQFRTIELAQPDVIEVISVFDSDGNEWTEVDYLAQDTVFDAVVNSAQDSDSVPYMLKLVTVPRRFVTDRDLVSSKTSLVFGSGDGVKFDDELVPNLADLALPLPGRRTFTSFALDPQNFLKTRSLGLSPLNTTLTVTYRVGGGPETNVPAGTINAIDVATLDFSSNTLDPTKVAATQQSLECVNFNRSDGGAPAETISEIKANSAAFFAAQNRVVTREDFIARVKSLPSKFGKPEKVYVKRNNISSTGIDLHVLALDPDGHLTLASPTLKQNIRTYLTPLRMITDGVNILDSNIINLRVNFGIVVTPKLNKTQVLTNCLNVVADYFHVSKMEIGQPISLSDLSSTIQAVLGVVSVFDLRITNVAGSAEGVSYSSVSFDVQAATSNNIIYCPEDSIFEVKFANKDILGVPK